MKKKYYVVVMLVMLVMLSACGKAKESKTKVRMGYFPNITHAQALVMKSQGTLEKTLGEEYDVSWTSFNAGPEEVEALFAGGIDIGYIGPVPAISANVKSNGDISMIAGATAGASVLVTRKDLVLDDVSDLDGKTIAIPQLGNTQHLFLLNLMTEHGLKTTANGGTVNVIAVGNSEIKTLMEQGEIDAALVPEPWGSILETQVSANVLLDYDKIWSAGDYPVAVVVSTKDFMEDHPEVVEAFLKVNREATLYINDQQEEAKTIVNKEIKAVTGVMIDTDILTKAFSRMVVSDAFLTESIFAIAAIDKKEGFIEKLPGENLIQDSFLNKMK